MIVGKYWTKWHLKKTVQTKFASQRQSDEEDGYGEREAAHRTSSAWNSTLFFSFSDFRLLGTRVASSTSLFPSPLQILRGVCSVLTCKSGFYWWFDGNLLRHSTHRGQTPGDFIGTCYCRTRHVQRLNYWWFYRDRGYTLYCWWFYRDRLWQRTARTEVILLAIFIGTEAILLVIFYRDWGYTTGDFIGTEAILLVIL